jgi:DNA-binding response OmpR family regulator
MLKVDPTLEVPHIAERVKGKKLSNIRAMVVDDDPIMRGLIRDVLGAAGIVGITETESAEGACGLLAERFDVLLIDLSGESCIGIDLVRKIRGSGINNGTPIILISDDQRPGATAEAFQGGANFVIYKPLDRAHLMSLIRVTQGTIESEKRRFRRVAVKSKITIKSTNAAVDGETVDVSLNGTLVRVPRTFPVRSTVEVSIYLLAGGPPVVGSGTVARIIGYNQMGIQLERLTVEESRRMQDYLLALMPE